MSKDPRVDRESFQQFLASAFAVQESQIDSRFLTPFLAVQGLVAGGDLDIDGVMNLVVDSTRDVAGAAGVAIGLLERDQLVYRAGSGCSASWIGVRFAASLTISAKIKDSREILRVENARTDTRIEGAICRQFGAESLLILPIYRDRLLAGVMEILFSEPHDYLDCEVRMYRLMVGLIEQAMCRAVRPEQLLPAELPAVRSAFEETPRSAERFTEKRPIFYAIGKNTFRRWGAALAAARQSPALQRPRFLPEGTVQRATEGLRAVGKNTFRRSGAALAAAGQSKAFQSLRRPRLLAEGMVQRATEVFANKPIWSLTLCAVLTALGLIFWMAHGGRGRATTAEPPASRSTAIGSVQPDVKPVNVTSKKRSKPTPVHEGMPAKLRNRRVREGQTEVDYIGDDVTVRHFTRTPARQRTAGQVAYIGKDVTIRHFTPKPVVKSQSQ